MNPLGWNDLNNVVDSDGFPLCATIIVATIDNMHIRRKYELDITHAKANDTALHWLPNEAELMRF